MPHPESNRRPWDAVTVRRSRRRERRGIVLVFVVVLLTLLAIMGTAYLATSRLDRQAVIGRGRLPGVTGNTLMQDRFDLDRVGDAMERAIQNAIIKDLFNQTQFADNDEPSAMNAAQAFYTFRQRLASSTYENYDAPGRADPWMASLLPRPQTADSREHISWPWISRALGQTVARDTTAATPVGGIRAESFFSDPRAIATSGAVFPSAGRWGEFNDNRLAEPDATLEDRHNAIIRSVDMRRSTASAAAPLDGTRVYPGLFPGLPAGSTPPATLDPFIAGDADGDGIADGGLTPVALFPDALDTSIDRYLDRENNVVYFVSYRVVDNSAKINLNTALTYRGDIVDNTILGSTTENQDRSAGTAPTSTTPILTRVGPTIAAPFELRNHLADDQSPQGRMSSASLMTSGGSVVPAPSSVAPQPALDGTFGPNYGFFRGNVGVTELIRDLLIPLNQEPNSTDNYRLPAEQELRRLVDARFPRLRQDPGIGTGPAPLDGYRGLAGNATTLREYDIERPAQTFNLGPALTSIRLGTADAPDTANFLRHEYRSLNDMLEQQLARRLKSPGGYLWSNTPSTSTIPANALNAFGFGDTAAFSGGGGALANPLLPLGTAEQALLFTTRLGAPNVNQNGDAPWKWFPASAWDLWFGWTQEFDVAQDPEVAATGTTLAQVPQIDVLDAESRIDSPLGPSPTVAGRAFYYRSDVFGSAAQMRKFNSPNKPSDTAGGSPNVRLMRSPRNLFTTYNGVTSAVPMRGDMALAGASIVFPSNPTLPLGMPAYSLAGVRNVYPTTGTLTDAAYQAAGVELDPSPLFYYPPTKVSAASGSKEQLWRAFWSSMTIQDASGRWEAAPRIATSGPVPNAFEPDAHYTAFRSSDRWPTVERWRVPASSTTPLVASGTTAGGADAPSPNSIPYETLSARQMALIRSAVAACNTIDLRDGDNDVTAMTIDITDDNSVTNVANTPVVPGPNSPRYYTRVFGTEKQLVISGLYLQRGGGGTHVAVEVYNPSDEPINLSSYRLHVAQRVDPSTVTPIGSESKYTGKIEVDEGGGAVGSGAGMIRLAPATGAGSNATLLPGGYMIVYTLPIPAVADAVTTATPPSLVPPITLPTAEVPAPTSGQAQIRYLAAPSLTAAQILALQNLVTGVPRNRELVLSRTRRADNVLFDDATNDDAVTGDPDGTGATDLSRARRQVVEDEVDTDPRTLVPVDAVDCRFNAAVSGSTAPDPVRFMYIRSVPAARKSPTDTAGLNNADPLRQQTPANNEEYNDERPNAWRSFYAGKFYDTRPHPARSGIARVAPAYPAPAAATTVQINDEERRDPMRPSSLATILPGHTQPITRTAPLPATTATPIDSGELNTNELDLAGFAWRDVTDATTTVGFGPISGRARLGLIAAPRTEPDVVQAPPIPIQTFAPLDPYTETKAAYTVNERGRVAVPATIDGVSYTQPSDALQVWGLIGGGTSYTAAVSSTPSIRGLFHLLNKFPFGSPFARDGDLMSIPYIGSYKIYRQIGAAAADTELYEFVPLPMDAVAVAPYAQLISPGIVPPPTPSPEVLTIGRFDPRPLAGRQPEFYTDVNPPTVPPNPRHTSPHPYTGTPRHPIAPTIWETKSGIPNEWAANLTDFVTARHATFNLSLPDLPDTSRDVTFFEVPPPIGPTGVPPEYEQDQRWTQDGPVTGRNAANPYHDVQYVRYEEQRGTVVGTDPSVPLDPPHPNPASLTVTDRADRRTHRRGMPVGAKIGGEAELIQGVLNINTAPQVNLRQLPFLVSSQDVPTGGYAPGTGQVDYLSSDPLGWQARALVNWVDRARATDQNLPVDAQDPGRRFGFDSIWSLNLDRQLYYDPLPTAAYSPTTIANNRNDMSGLMKRAVRPTAEFPTFPIGGTIDTLNYPDASNPPTANELIRVGMLNPVGRNEWYSDYRYATANATRISNLTSTRSDVYTVYVTVQAWSYVGNIAGANQLTDTRLVGERRTSFVVDRSKISQTAYSPSNLVIFPIERE